MRRLFLALLTLSLVSVANVASAYEFRLQFTPPTGARVMTVAGYSFLNSTTVKGACNYYTQSACSGRGCHSIRTNYYDTCTWDLGGNLKSMVSGSLTAPASLGTVNTYEIVYAYLNATTFTGVDTRGYGYVDTPAAHYSWVTPNASYADINYTPYSIDAELISDGSEPLVVSGANVVAQIYGTVTPSSGTATIAGDTCLNGSIAPGSTCDVTITYDPTTISCTASPYGYAYTGIDLSLITNAGANTDFTERFTVMGVPLCDD